MAGLSFDRVAATCDESRDGEARGRTIATDVVPYLTASRVVSSCQHVVVFERV